MLQNFPVITSATTTQVKGKLKSRPRKTFTIQLSSSTQSDPSGFGEGETFMGEIEVRTNIKGARSFTFQPDQPVSDGTFVTATATDASGNTSEFSPAQRVE